MKMVKKILLGLAATAAVLSLASCKMEAGEGKTEGNKWDLTMTVDGTKIADTVQPNAKGQGPYRRFWKQFSSSEKVAEIETTVTIDTNACTIEPNTVATAGLVFDLNKNATDSSKVDFNLIGLSPSAGFYVERYTEITKKDGDYDTSEGALSSTYTPLKLDSFEYSNDGKGAYISWGSIPNTPKEGVYTYKIKITQANKKYSVSINGVKVAEYNASDSTNVDTIDKKEYAVGGIACYGSVQKGNILKAKYESDKDSVTGKLYEEVEE